MTRRKWESVIRRVRRFFFFFLTQYYLQKSTLGHNYRAM